MTGFSQEEQQSVIPVLEDLLEPNPRRIKSFINGLAVEKRRLGKVVDLRLLALVFYLRTHHADIHRLLAYDPGNLALLDRVLTEDAEQPIPNPAPVQLLFRRAFHHAFPRALDKLDAAGAAEIEARQDRHRTDTAFMKLWRELLGETPGSGARQEYLSSALGALL